MKRTFLFAVLLVAGNIGALAQTGAPKKPFVHHAPDFASWTITYAYKPPAGASTNGQAQPSSEGKREVSETVTKTNKTLWVQTAWSTGEKEEMWIYNGKQYETANQGRSIVLVPPPAPDDPSPDYSDYNKHDFSGFDWLSLSTYTSVGTYQGKPVYMFAKMEGASKSEAYLSTDTQLPLYATDGQISCTYTYNPPPSVPLTLPQRYLDFIEQRRRGEEALKYRPSPP